VRLTLQRPGPPSSRAIGRSTRVSISPAFTKKLKKSKVTVKASGGTLKTFSFKISDGDAALQTNSVGSFDHASTNITFKKGTKTASGGVELSKPSDPAAPSRQVYDFAFEFGATRSLTAAASVLFGNRLTVGDVEGGSVTTALTAGGGTVTFTNLLLRFNALAAQSLQGDYKCDPPVPAGIALGTVNGSATVK
jgi:hypothetical protein